MPLGCYVAAAIRLFLSALSFIFLGCLSSRNNTIHTSGCSINELSFID